MKSAMVDILQLQTYKKKIKNSQLNQLFIQ
jgi:hypothetical protein